MAENYYYWLKLKRDFFKRHDIRIVENMPNGKDYILFYLKLLCESVDHEGNLRFSEEIPYNEDMLATITDTNIDVVRAAIKIFSQLGMIDILDNGTYYMNEVSKMIGKAADNDNARRQQRFRDKQKTLSLPDSVTKSNAGVTDVVTNDNESKSIELDIDIDKDIDIYTPPKESKHKHGEYGHVLLKDSELDKLKAEYGDNVTDACITFLDEYIEMKGYKAKSHYLCIKKWVIDAVKKKHPNTPADKLDESYNMMAEWARGE